MQNYQCLGKSYQPRLRLAGNSYSTLIILHITKTSSNNCLLEFLLKKSILIWKITNLQDVIKALDFFKSNKTPNKFSADKLKITFKRTNFERKF